MTIDNNQLISNLEDVFTQDANGNITGMVIANISAANITTTGISNLGQIGNVRIFGGSNGQALVTAGNGSLAWANIGSGVSGITAGNGIQVANVGNNYTVSANVVDILAGTNIVVGVSDGKYTISSTGGGGGSGTVTSVGITAGTGISVANTPVTSSGNITVTNTGVTSITAGTNITVSASNGAVTISSTGGGGATTPGGSNTQVQFNDGGVFAGSSGFTWNKNTATLTVTNLAATNITGSIGNANYAANSGFANNSGNAANANVANLAQFATVANSVAGANVTGTVGNALYANVAGIANVANTVNDAAQPNITSVGTLTSLTVSGVSTLGAVGNLRISGGSPLQFLQTDGNSNLSWATVSTSSISNGNANVVVDANAGVRISTGGTANVVVVNTVGTSVTGNLSVGGNITTTANASVGNLAVSGAVSLFNLSLGGNLAVSGNTGVTNITASGVSNLGAVGNVRITGGSSGQFLRTDGAGNLTWATPSGGGGSANTAILSSVQYGTEVVTTVPTANGTYNYDVITSSIKYLNTVTGNINPNFRGNSTTSLDGLIGTGNAITVTMLVNQGSSNAVVVNTTVDGNSVIPKWISYPVGYTNTVTQYTFTLIKTATNTWTILANWTRYQ